MLKSILLGGVFAVGAVVAMAQSGPAQLDGPANRSKLTITSYSDSDGRHLAGKLTLAELTFPLRVFEETPTGMVRIRNADKDYWVASEDFKIGRSVQADCNVAMPRVTTGADRGANEGCTGVKKK